jgi:hypothetical protein
MCDKNTCGQESLSNAHLQTETTLAACRYPTSLPYSHGLPCLCRGRDLLSCRPVAALIWLRDCPRSRKSQPGSTQDGHTEQTHRLGLHPSCLQAAWVDWGGRVWGRGGRAPWSQNWRYIQIFEIPHPQCSPQNPQKWPGHGRRPARPQTLSETVSSGFQLVYPPLQPLPGPHSCSAYLLARQRNLE